MWIKCTAEDVKSYKDHEILAMAQKNAKDRGSMRVKGACVGKRGQDRWNPTAPRKKFFGF